MTKVVINRCFGGFSLSEKAVLWIRKHAPCAHRETLVGEAYEDGSINSSGFSSDINYGHASERTCPSLVAAVETLGDVANGRFAELAVVEVPDDVSWEIDKYDGNEHIAESHRTWH